MDTDGIRLFVLAAEKLNISAAGRELGMAPAVASAKLAKLEKALKVDLLHRSTRRVALSVDGEDFLPYAREILAQETAALAALGHGSSEAKGTLRFAASSTFAQLYFAPLVAEFMSRYPGIDLDLKLSDMSFDLIEGSFDLALRSAPMKDSSFKARKLADDVRILCASPSYLDRHGRPRDPEDLSDHHFIAFKDLSPKPLLHEDGSTSQVDPRQTASRLLVDDGNFQRSATLAGAGVSVNSLWSVHSELENGSLVRVLPEYQINDRSALWLVYPKSNVLTAKVRTLIDFLIEKIGDQPPWLS